MSKAVLISIQPYYVFLIIAKAMRWDIPQEKTIEVRKTIPRDKDWNRKAIIYCSKNKKSFAKIPKEYQPLMEKFLGKVIGEFVCDEIIEILPDNEIYGTYDISDDEVIASCLVNGDLWNYGKGKTLYGFHISDLVIYDKPKDLDEFMAFGKSNCDCKNCVNCLYMGIDGICDIRDISQPLFRPPQSYCYVEELP